MCRKFLIVHGNDRNDDYVLTMGTDQANFEIVQLTNCLFTHPQDCNPAPPKVYKRPTGKYKELDEIKKEGRTELARSISASDRTHNLSDNSSLSKQAIQSGQSDDQSAGSANRTEQTRNQKIN